MIQSELINKVALETGLEKATTERVLKAFLYEIIAELSMSRSAMVKLKGFGTFDVRKRRTRRGWNPAAGEHQVFPASYAVKFRQSPVLDIADKESVAAALQRLKPHRLRRRPKAKVRAKRKVTPANP